MFNNDERTEFLNGANDRNLAVAYDGTYAGGGAVEFRRPATFTFTLSPWIRKADSQEMTGAYLWAVLAAYRLRQAALADRPF